MNRGTQLQMTSETLSEDELATITGYKTPSFQRQWLTRNAWEYVLTGARRPVVGRVYARLKLAGVNHQQPMLSLKPGPSTYPV